MLKGTSIVWLFLMVQKKYVQSMWVYKWKIKITFKIIRPFCCFFRPFIKGVVTRVQPRSLKCCRCFRSTPKTRATFLWSTAVFSSCSAQSTPPAPLLVLTPPRVSPPAAVRHLMFPGPRNSLRQSLFGVTIWSSGGLWGLIYGIHPWPQGGPWLHRSIDSLRSQGFNGPVNRTF